MAKYQIQVCTTFNASHQLRLSDGQWEPVHSHNWQVQLTIGAEQLDDIETVMDFHELEALLASAVRPLTGQVINQVPPFSEGINPSAERVAEHIASKLSGGLPAHISLIHVKIMEAPECWAIYTRSI